jgi:hypothetical protein
MADAMFDPAGDWHFVEWWVRWPKWLRVLTGVIVLVPGGVVCRGNPWAGGIIVTLGLVMLVHGILAGPEEGPGPD